MPRPTQRDLWDSRQAGFDAGHAAGHAAAMHELRALLGVPSKEELEALIEEKLADYHRFYHDEVL